jgi:hypothetical protein
MVSLGHLGGELKALDLDRLGKQVVWILQIQQQHSLLSQASWGRLEMKPKRDDKQGDCYGRCWDREERVEGAAAELQYPRATVPARVLFI